MPETRDTFLLELLKAVADESRLQMLRLLHNQEYAVGELAARVELSEPTVSHHLAKLRDIGLVNLRMAGNQRFYRTNLATLATLKQLVNEIEWTPLAPEPVVSDEAWIDALGWAEEDAQVLREYSLNGRFVRLPSKLKKTLVILRYLATLFEPDRDYTENEVNAIIKSVYEPDYVSLRRDLISVGHLQRERGGARYWRTRANEA